MKLSSISLIAVALAAITGSTAAPSALRPVERNLFERGVNVYSRGLPTFTKPHHMDHEKVCRKAKHAIALYNEVTNLASQKGDSALATCSRGSVPELRRIHEKHQKQLQIEGLNKGVHGSISTDLEIIKDKKKRAVERIEKLKHSAR